MKKYHVYLTYDERRTIISILINKKNELIMTGYYTDAIDEVLEKLMKAKVKKVRVKEDY